MEKQIWNLDRIKDLISNNEEESLTLEFKNGDVFNLHQKDRTKLKEEIGKDVASFANASGGVIIYGIEEANGKAKGIFAVDQNYLKSKGQLSQIIQSNIDPTFTDFLITTIPFEYCFIYVVEIEQGKTAYMAKDKIHYRRVDATTIKMDAQMLRDVMNRISTPILELIFEFDNEIDIFENDIRIINKDSLDEPYHKNLITVGRIFVNNIGLIYAKYINVFIYFPKIMLYCSSTNDESEIFGFNTSNINRGGNYNPILPNTGQELARFYCFWIDIKSVNIEYKIVADNSVINKQITLTKEDILPK
jgi:hypothetical protein